MSLTAHESAQLSIDFPREHAEQINAKAAKYRMMRGDVSQELSRICLEQGPKYDPAKGTLPQFLFGHLDKTLRRQLGAHTFAVSLDRDDLDESTRAYIENTIVPADDDNEAPHSFTLDQPGLAKIMSIAHFVSGKSSSDLARALGVTPRRVRQILQQLREEEAISNQFELCLGENC